MALEKDMSQAHNHYFHQYIEICVPVLLIEWGIPSSSHLPLKLRLFLSQVCTYESMQAGLHHLKRMGVQKLTQPSSLAAAMNQLPDEAITLAAASHIERELQITPWNLSSNFVAATMQVYFSLCCNVNTLIFVGCWCSLVRIVHKTEKWAMNLAKRKRDAEVTFYSG